MDTNGSTFEHEDAKISLGRTDIDPTCVVDLANRQIETGFNPLFPIGSSTIWGNLLRIFGLWHVCVFWHVFFSKFQHQQGRAFVANH